MQLLYQMEPEGGDNVQSKIIDYCSAFILYPIWYNSCWTVFRLFLPR